MLQFSELWNRGGLKRFISGEFHQCEELKKTDFASLLNEVIKKRLTPEILTNDFRKCGLVPWDMNAIPLDKLISSDSTEKTETQQIEVRKLEKHLKCLEMYVQVDHSKEFKTNENKNWKEK